jgi:hypothetical protein
MDKVEIDIIFPKNTTATTRGHKYKIYKKHCRRNRRKYSFSQRVVAQWNALPESVIDATSVNVIMIQHSQIHSVIIHCDTHITLLSNTETVQYRDVV